MNGEKTVKLLLTSAGVTNDSIRTALVDLLGKSIDESNAICIPTAIYALAGGNGFAWQELKELAEMGWEEFGVAIRYGIESDPNLGLRRFLNNMLSPLAASARLDCQLRSPYPIAE